MESDGWMDECLNLFFLCTMTSHLLIEQANNKSIYILILYEEKDRKCDPLAEYWGGIKIKWSTCCRDRTN